MAKQIGLIKLKGSIGDLSFYERQGIALVRKKAGPSKQAIEMDPRYQRTKENALEFGHTAQHSKLLRRMLREVLFQCTDPSFSRRLVSRMSMIVKSDTQHPRGERTITAKGLRLLKGLESNREFRFNEQILFEVAFSYDVAKGNGLVRSAAFIPALQIRRFAGCTHAQLVIAITEFGCFTAEKTEPLIWRSAYYSLSDMQTKPDEEFSFHWVPSPGNAVIVLVGVSYFEEIAGAYFPVAKGKYNALWFSNVYCHTGCI